MRKRMHRRPPQSGFTLMEILLVLVILVMLGSLAVSAFTGTQDQANRNTAKIQVETVDKAAKRYRLTMNRYPQSLQDLMQAPSDAKPGQWGGPYLDRVVAADPWGNEYQYAIPGQHNPDSFDVWSMGPDLTSGSEDDIGNWNVQQ